MATTRLIYMALNHTADFALRHEKTVGTGLPSHGEDSPILKRVWRLSLWVVYLQDASLGCYQCAACLQFPSTDTVLVQVVVVHLNDVEGGIGVVFPATAQVYNIVYTTYLEVTREGQTQSIVFTIGGIGYMDFAQYGSIECSGSAQTVDAQCVVAAVLRSPFFVVDYARRYGVLSMSVSMYVPTTMAHFCS